MWVLLYMSLITWYMVSLSFVCSQYNLNVCQTTCLIERIYNIDRLTYIFDYLLFLIERIYNIDRLTYIFVYLLHSVWSVLVYHTLRLIFKSVDGSLVPPLLYITLLVIHSTWNKAITGQLSLEWTKTQNYIQSALNFYQFRWFYQDKKSFATGP